MSARAIGILARSARLSVEFIGYAMVSALALAVDWALLVACTEWLGLHYSVSATIGFCAGLTIAYALSVAFVFRERAVADRRFEFVVFALVGVCGLGLTQILMRTIVETTGFGYAQAKAPTAVLVFLFNFAVRRAILFSRWPRSEGARSTACASAGQPSPCKPIVFTQVGPSLSNKVPTRPPSPACGRRCPADAGRMRAVVQASMFLDRRASEPPSSDPLRGPPSPASREKDRARRLV